jgi:hypothetical protein
MTVKRVRQGGFVCKRGAGGQDAPVGIDLQGIGVDDQAVVAGGKFHRQRGFSAGRGARDQNRHLARYVVDPHRPIPS